jgi:hypothetical protein
VAGERIPAKGRDIEKLAPTGNLVTGTPRAVAFDQYMMQGGTDLVWAELVRGTAIELGQACDGGDRGCLGLGSKPLQLHVSNHFGA